MKVFWGFKQKQLRIKVNVNSFLIAYKLCHYHYYYFICIRIASRCGQMMEPANGLQLKEHLTCSNSRYRFYKCNRFDSGKVYEVFCALFMTKYVGLRDTYYLRFFFLLIIKQLVFFFFFGASRKGC